MSAQQLRVLIVSAQLPFPPRFGFATRVYHLARQLAGRHDVALLTYASPRDDDHVEQLRHELAVTPVLWEPSRGVTKRLRQAASMLSMTPFACRAVHSRVMQDAIDRMCRQQRFDLIQVESSLLCQFRFPLHTPLVLDSHNIEYEVFRRMQHGERSPLRRGFHRLEHARYRRFEQASWRRVAGLAVTSEREQQIMHAAAPATPTMVVPNGVDLDQFRPGGEVEPATVVFNALLAYRPNLDAAYFLVDRIWPLVVARCPRARLTIVGRGDEADLARLRRPGVDVTGEVPDVRPYLAAAAVVCAPIRMGGGTRLKIIEALAMGKPIVSTRLGCEGVRAQHNQHLLIADSAQEIAASVTRLFDEPDTVGALGRAGRVLAEREHAWDLAGRRLDGLYRSVLARTAADPRGVNQLAASVAPRTSDS